MNPDDPESAQQIVADYAQVLGNDLEAAGLPASVDSLPYAKPTIKSAIRTSARTLIANGQLTEELRDFLQTAYVSLADYVGADLARLMKEYQESAEHFASDSRLVREKLSTTEWQTLGESSRLAGEIARSIAGEAQQLELEFRELIA